MTADEAIDLLYDLVDDGMNLHPKVSAQVQKKLRKRGTESEYSADWRDVDS